MASKLKRRTLLLGGVAAGAAATVGLKPRDRGENHSDYFQRLGTALHSVQTGKPTLVVDKDKLLSNVNTLKSHIRDHFAYRIVAKSLPAIGLLKTIMSAANTRRLMLFHQPFLSQVARELPDSDVLMGKPMPVNAAKAFYKHDQHVGKNNGFNPATQLQWLLDSKERLEQYAALADSLEVNMRINIEIDVGLHRGGVKSDDELLAMLQIILQHPRLGFSGFMGYEPHVVKVPGNPISYRDRAMKVYRQRLDSARAFFGEQWPDDITLNCGGSPTYQLYDEGDYPFNELSAGSCLVKPTDFDLDTLLDHQPASYIATPVLKVLDNLQLPVDGIGPLISAWDPNREKSFFIYGGYWKAVPESPKGLSTNPLMGRSTNQEMLNGSHSIDLKPDDWVFLRPTQSEFVFVQFGDIAVYQAGAIVDHWPVLSNT